MQEKNLIFSKNLKIILKILDLTPKELAEALDINPSSVSKWLNAKGYPSSELLVVIGELGISTDYLFGNSYTLFNKNENGKKLLNAIENENNLVNDSQIKYFPDINKKENLFLNIVQSYKNRNK